MGVKGVYSPLYTTKICRTLTGLEFHFFEWHISFFPVSGITQK